MKNQWTLKIYFFMTAPVLVMRMLLSLLVSITVQNGIEYKKNICFYVHSIWIYTKYSSPTSHRAQIPSSSDEVSSDGSELEFA